MACNRSHDRVRAKVRLGPGETPGVATYTKEHVAYKPVAMAKWVVHQTAEQEVSGSNPGIPPLLKHVYGEGDWLLCLHYTLAKVLYQRWISGNIYHIHLHQIWIRQNPL